MRLGVLASGNGSNLQAIINACASGYIPDSSVKLVISNKKDAYALERAKKSNIDHKVIEPPKFKKFERGMNIKEIMIDPLRREYDLILVELFQEKNIDLVCLAGYMLFVTPAFLEEFSTINIHPAILPSFKGLHGVMDAYNYGVRITGCTTHFVDDEEDHGPIILQAITPVIPDEPPDQLKNRNIIREHLLFPETLRIFQKNLLKVNGRKVDIIWDQKHIEFNEKLIELWRSDLNDYYNRSQ